MEVVAQPAHAAWEVEERVDMQGPHVSDTRERERESTTGKMRILKGEA
jgi:hypothetical protein